MRPTVESVFSCVSPLYFAATSASKKSCFFPAKGRPGVFWNGTKLGPAGVLRETRLPHLGYFIPRLIPPLTKLRKDVVFLVFVSQPVSLRRPPEECRPESGSLRRALPISFFPFRPCSRQKDQLHNVSFSPQSLQRVSKESSPKFPSRNPW